MEREFVISNEHGIHARPTTAIVQKANQFKSNIDIIFNGATTDLKSIMGVLSLGVTRGSLITIRISGEDEAQAMKELSKLIKDLNVKK